jgi:hypothetical protein
MDVDSMELRQLLPTVHLGPSNGAGGADSANNFRYRTLRLSFPRCFALTMPDCSTSCCAVERKWGALLGKFHSVDVHVGALELVRGCYKIRHKGVRKRIFDLLEAMSAGEHAPAAR